MTEQTTVSAASPLVNTAETRNEMTLGTDALSTLPLAGRSYISLVTMAPGVSGLGTMGGGQPGGAPALLERASTTTRPRQPSTSARMARAPWRTSSSSTAST